MREAKLRVKKSFISTFFALLASLRSSTFKQNFSGQLIGQFFPKKSILVAT
jgi:hypothetical protein